LQYGKTNAKLTAKYLSALTMLSTRFQYVLDIFETIYHRIGGWRHILVKDYWGSFSSGRLGRKRFIGLWVLLIVTVILLGLVVGVGIGIAENLVGGNLTEAQDTLRQRFSVPAVIGIALAGLLFLVAKLNIIAKRARDIGLPGWITTIVIAGLVGVVSQGSEPTMGGGLGMLILIVLALIPTNALKRP
jgi:uncharacterized membrane protein YhaH (DUF805 family)